MIFFGCSSDEIIVEKSADYYFKFGMSEFQDENYFEAIENFKTVTLQFSVSKYGDSAQYYLGECYFARKEFLLAAYEYEMLKKTMSLSELLPLAQFKLAMCYYQLSPKHIIEQKYTYKAIDEFQIFLEYYPSHDSSKIATEKIRELILKLAKKELETGNTYLQLENYKSAIHYFKNVIEKFHDTPYVEDAQLGIVEAMINRKKFKEAKEELEFFFTKYPKSEKKERAESLEKSIDEKF